jgi:hypothetical protein
LLAFLFAKNLEDKGIHSMDTLGGKQQLNHAKDALAKRVDTEDRG